MSASVIVAGARTPIGRLLGGLATVPASGLGAVAIRAALERARVAPESVEYVIMGQVLTAGAGQLPARQAAEAAGIPMSTPALTVSKVCLSGIQAIILADQFISSGTYSVVVAGGQESMSLAPRLLGGSRIGEKFGPVTLLDHMAIDGLEDAFSGESMGLLAEDGNDRDPIPREGQDAFALASHLRAAQARDAGRFDEEIAPVTVPIRHGTVTVDSDEGIRADASLEAFAGLKPAFRAEGSVTAGNASPISDGACALVVMAKDAAEANGIEWIAEIGAHGMVSGPDTLMQLQPANAIRAACRKQGIDPRELDLIEINEAFSAVALASAGDLGVPIDRVNVNGGAVALGHPIGMSGARLVLHLALELARRGGGVGAAALCGGGGQGDALIVSVPRGASGRD